VGMEALDGHHRAGVDVLLLSNNPEATLA